MVTGSADTDLDDLRQQFLREHLRLESLCAESTQLLKAELRVRRLAAVEVDARVKDVASFIKKAMRKSYNDPWTEIRDKVGIRLTTIYADSIRDLEELIRDVFIVHHYEDKRSSLQPQELDYLGSHFEVSLPPGTSKAGMEELIVEIQVHSVAEGLWAGISHELLYKAPAAAPAAVERSLYRLLALVELFDLEVDRARTAIMDQPGFPETVVLRELERHFFALTAHTPDIKLSRVVISALRPLLSDEELENYSILLEAFVAANGDKLRTIYDDYLEDDRNPLMSQPESLLVFERLENVFQRVPAVWQETLPESLLHSFASIWGTPIDDDE